MHTAGEPVRIVTDGYPALPGATILEKRRYAQAKLDHIRRRLMLEPRGHADMYGVIPVEPSHPEAHLAVLFTHNSGYSTMCGHATIAIGRWAVEMGEDVDVGEVGADEERRGPERGALPETTARQTGAAPPSSSATPRQ